MKAAFFVALIAALCACNPSQPKAPPVQAQASEKAAPTSAGQDPEALGILIQPHRERAPLGSECANHSACELPLKCISYVCAVPQAVDGTAPENAGQVLLNAGSAHPRTVYVETALEPMERQLGLMFRTRMAPDWGMIFVFNGESQRSFWMRNTFLPLDMLFISSTGTIVNIKRYAKPLDERPRYESAGPARYVLELNAGYTEEHGIQAGQKVQLVDVPGDHDPAILTP